MNSKARIALVVPALAEGGGVPAVAEFIYHVLVASNRYQPDFISLATSSRDQASLRLLSPRSWFTGLQVISAQWRGRDFRHVGCHFAEFEFQRYQPRRVLTELLNQYDLVHVIAGAPAWALVARDVLRPVIIFAATTVKHERASLLRESIRWRRFWSAIMTEITAQKEYQALHRVDFAFAESDYTLGLLRAHMPADHLALGVPGVDACYFTPALKYAESGYWLWVGRLNDPRKNCHILLEGYAKLFHRLPDIPALVFAGSGGWKSQYAAQAAELGIAGRVQVYCNVSADRLRELYQGASVFILSSNEEGLGMVILEAMASGLPVVSTDCGGPSTAIKVGETGLLTQVGDADALADALQVLWEQPALRRKMGEAGRKRVFERFSVESAGEVYLQKYEELLGSARQTIKGKAC